MGWTTTYKPKGEPMLDFFIREGIFTWGEDCPNTYRTLAKREVKKYFPNAKFFR